MRIKTLAASCTFLLAHSIATAAPAPPLMTPTGPWNVEFADSMCLLSRPYGKDRATNLIFKPSMIGNSLEIIVTKASTSIGYQRSGPALLSISDKMADNDAGFTAYSTSKVRLLRIRVGDDKIALPTVRGTLSIDAKSEGRHLFAIPGIERALPVLSKCVAQLRAIYKVSEADMAGIVKSPEYRPSGLFSSDDYPSEALTKGQYGTVGVLFWVETTGRISTCEIIESSAGPVLEQATCDILKRRARFTTATDVQGKAIRAPGFSRIRWVLPS